MSKQVYNKIYTLDKWNDVNTNNKNYMFDFIEELHANKKSEGTIKQYKNDLRIFLIYLLDSCNNINLENLNRKDFRRFSLWLLNTCNMSNARVNRVMSSVRSFFDYLENDDDTDIDINYASKIKGLQKQAIRTDNDYFFIEHNDIMLLRDYLVKNNKLVDALILMIAYDSGARRNEIAQITKYNILDNNYTNIVQGKRGKKFKLRFHNDTKLLIEEYLKQRGEDDIDSLFITNHGGNVREITYEGIYTRWKAMLKILSDLKGKEYNCAFHSIRHSTAENLLNGLDDRFKDENGNNKKFTLNQIKVLLHHDNISTTELYVKNRDDEIINEMFN